MKIRGRCALDRFEPGTGPAFGLVVSFNHGFYVMLGLSWWAFLIGAGVADE